MHTPVGQRMSGPKWCNARSWQPKSPASYELWITLGSCFWSHFEFLYTFKDLEVFGVCNSCWQAGPAELEAEDLDEALADARVLRNWGEAAVEQVDKYQSC